MRFVSVNFLGNQTESKQYPLATFNGNDVRLLWRIGLLELLSLRIRGRDLVGFNWFSDVFASSKSSYNYSQEIEPELT